MTIKVPFGFRYQEALNSAFSEICANRRKSGAPYPEKRLVGTQIYQVTYRSAARRYETGRMELQCSRAGDRVYEALYMLRRLGIEASRVRVSEVSNE